MHRCLKPCEGSKPSQGHNIIRSIHLTNLCHINIDAHGEFNVTDMISTEACVHNARDEGIVCSVFIELDTLYEREGAVSNANNCDTYFFTCHEMRSPYM